MPNLLVKGARAGLDDAVVSQKVERCLGPGLPPLDVQPLHRRHLGLGLRDPYGINTSRKVATLYKEKGNVNFQEGHLDHMWALLKWRESHDQHAHAGKGPLCRHANAGASVREKRVVCTVKKRKAADASEEER